MDQCTASIQNKISRVKELLLDLNKEILTSVKFLLQLRENSTEIVKNLNSITTPANYLKEFVDVNAFILKYLNFLIEINCKFEMWEISDKKFSTVISVSKAITSELIPKGEADFSSGFDDKNPTDLKFLEVTEALEAVIAKQSPESNDSESVKIPKTKKAKSKKNKNSEKVPSENKRVTAINNTNTVNNNITNKQKSDKNLKKASAANSKCNSSSKKKPVSDVHCSLRNVHSNNCLNENSSQVDSSSSVKSYSSVTKTEKKSKNKLVNEFCTKDSKNSNSNKFQSNRIQSSEDRLTSKLSNNSQWSQKQKCEEIRENQLSDCKEYPYREEAINPPNIVRNVDKEYDVVIENIKSPSEFYVSIVGEQSNLFAELEKKMKLIPQNKSNNYYKVKENRKTCMSKEIGTYALFYSKCDETWCRAKVINWCLDFEDDFVSIFLLDYGEYKCVSVDCLMSMPESFKKYPAFVQRCHLHGVYPLDMDDECNKLSWEKESSENMKLLTENSKNIRIKIAPEDRYHSVISLPVTLWLVDKGNQCVNELLVKNKCAVSSLSLNRCAKKTESLENEKLNNWNPMKEDFLSYRNSYDLDIKDPAAIIYGYVGKDYDRICPHFAKNGFCFKGGACKKEHQKLDPLGFTTDQEEVYKNAFNTMPIPSPKSLLNVQVTCLLSFNHFCCIAEVCSLSSDEEDLESLSKSINKARNIQKMKKLLVPPSVGQIVLAQYSEDLNWYRARILESEPEKDQYRVLFVDYGNKETLPIDHIRAIEPKYLHLPFQAMNCFIFGVERNPEIPLKNVVKYMNKRMGNQHISIEVVSSLPGDSINLIVYAFDQIGRNIGDDLIAKGYAVSKRELLVSTDSQTIPG